MSEPLTADEIERIRTVVGVLKRLFDTSDDAQARLAAAEAMLEGTPEAWDHDNTDLPPEAVTDPLTTRTTGRDAAPGQVLAEGKHAGISYRVVRGMVSLCAYVGVTLAHPWYGRDYDEIEAELDVELIFAGPVKWGGTRWWLGWDHAHLSDRILYPDKVEKDLIELGFNQIVLKGRVWYVDEVEDEALAVCEVARQVVHDR